MTALEVQRVDVGLGADVVQGVGEAVSPYAAAAAERVDATPALEPYRDVILYEWPEPEHFTWAATCDLAELVSWAEAVSEDEDATGSDTKRDGGTP